MNEKETFKPYISADTVMPEFTPFAIIAGIVLSVVFGAANAYLGLRVGMTVSASVPAAVISMGTMRILFKRNSILESNMVQTIGSAGESVASGIIFTIPALFMWAKEGICDVPSLFNLSIIALCGGLLGVFIMLPLRNALIVKEHGVLGYPEGTACAEVLKAGEKGNTKSGTVFAGLGIAALYKFIADGLKIFPSEINWQINKFKGSAFGVDVLPALAGVGYICGPQTASYMFAGSILGWFVLMPLMMLFGSDIVIFPATTTIAEVFAESGVSGIWSNYLRYIGAGALATGGIISLIKNMPMIFSTFKAAFKGYGKNSVSVARTEQEIPQKVSFIAAVLICLFIGLYPGIKTNLLGSLIILIFGFFFATVAARIVGIVGSSNNPASGMTIATLLITSVIIKATGTSQNASMVSALSIGCVICLITTMAADMSQDLKTGYLVGATPKKQQYGEIIGAVAAAISIGAIITLLNEAWGFGSQEISAPQATMMKMVIEGVMGGKLPWALVIMGVFLAITFEILKLPVLTIAMGIYLPIHINAGILAGGLIRYFVEKRKYNSDEEKDSAVQSGILYTSGLIAGEGIIGIGLAVLAVIDINGRSLGEIVDLSSKINLGNIGGAIAFLILLATIVLYTLDKKKKAK